MDLHYKQEVTVGLLVVAGLVVMIGGLTYLSGKSIFGSRTMTFGVQLPNVAGLVQGDPVQVSGVRVGRVVFVGRTTQETGPVARLSKVGARVRVGPGPG